MTTNSTDTPPLTPQEVATLRAIATAAQTGSSDTDKPEKKIAVKKAGLAIFVIVLLAGVAMATVLCSGMLFPGIRVEGYLALVAAGGSLGLGASPFATLMKALNGDEDFWDVVAATGKVFAGLWAAIVSLVTAML